MAQLRFRDGANVKNRKGVAPTGLKVGTVFPTAYALGYDVTPLRG